MNTPRNRAQTLSAGTDAAMATGSGLADDVASIDTSTRSDGIQLALDGVVTVVATDPGVIIIVATSAMALSTLTGLPFWRGWPPS